MKLEIHSCKNCPGRKESPTECDHCILDIKKRSLGLRDTFTESPRWCPLRKGDVILRHSDRTLRRGMLFEYYPN